VTSWSATSIVATVPTGATTGNVVVNASGVNTSGVSFTVLATPTLTSLSPTSDAIGASITLTGTNLGASQGSGTVKFNGTTATVTSWSATSIVATVPTGATTGNVVVNASGVNTSGVSFTVLATPTVTGVTPSSGMVGVQVTITGTSFGSAQGSGSVTFNGTTATVVSWAATTIIVTVPTGATTGNINVMLEGVSVSGGTFTVTLLPTGWTDLDIGPDSGPGSASYATNVFTVMSTGDGVGGGNGNNATIDGLNFVYQPLSGDGTIIARVKALQGGWVAQAGVMIRQGLDSGSANAFSAIDSISSPTFYFWSRPSEGGSESYSGGPSALTLPYWLMLVRSGNTFTSYVAPDGINWVQLVTNTTVSMTQGAYIGLACTGGNNGSSAATCTFDNVSVSTDAAPGPVITSLSVTTGKIGSQVVIAGSGFGAAQGSSLATLNAAPVTINSWSSTSIVITIPTGAATGQMQVSVAPSMNDSNPVQFTITNNPLPSGWFDQDVGMVGLTGNAAYANGVFMVEAAGSNVTGTADAFHFVYQPFSGDGSITARVVTQQSSWSAQAGVMIRETLNADATNVFMTAQALSSPYLYFYDRPSTGASTSSPGYLELSTLPYWLQVVRSGSSFSVYESPDGINWVQLGATQTIAMAADVYVGLGVSSNNTTALSSATYDNVSVNSTVTPSPYISGVSATTAPVGSQVVISGSGFGPSGAGSIVTLNAVPVTINSWAANSITVTLPSGATTGLLVVSVAPSLNDSNAVQFTVTTNPLPMGWLDQDVGAVGVTGSSAYANGVFTVLGGGYGVGGTASGFTGGTQDSFHLVYQPLSGNGTLIARIVSAQSGTQGEGQFGVVIRAALGDVSTPNADVSYIVQNTDICLLDRATEASSEGEAGNSSTLSLPYWVKIVRSGNVFSGYLSADAINWVQLGSSQTITMPQEVFIGMGVSGWSTTTLGSATFDNVSLSTTASPGPVITAISATTGSVGSQITISGSGFGAAQGNNEVLLNGATTTIDSWEETSILITIPSGATSGPLGVMLSPSLNNSNAFEFTVTANPLPAGWLDQDVGVVGVAGNASYSGGVFTVNGGGLGVGGTGGGYGGAQDSFHFVYQPLAGNGTLTARIVTNPGSQGQAGIMIRQGLDNASLNVFMTNFPADTYGLLFDRPSTGSDETDSASAGYQTLPYWVQIVRSGNNFTASVSTNGTSWTQVGSLLSVPMSQNVYIGLGVSGGVSTSLGSATFDNVSTSFNGWGTSPSITSLSAASGAVGTAVTITGINLGSSGTVTFNGTAATTTTWNSTTIATTVPANASTGNVVVTVGGVASNGIAFGVFNPVASSVSPPAAEAGATVTLTGSGFGTIQGDSQIQFNGVAAGVTSWSNTSITAILPSNVTSGPVTVLEGGVRSNGVQFSVETLSIAGISPPSASAGTAVTITGTGFGSVQANSTVDFFGATAAIQSWSDTQIVAIVPGAAPSGSVDVTVGGIIAFGPEFTTTQTFQLTDSKNNQTSYTSVLIGGMWLPLSGDGSGCSTCSQRGTISYTYDTSGHQLSRTDENGHTTSYTYDSNGDVLTVTVPISATSSATTTYTYNSFGEVLTDTDPLGNVSSNTYDVNGNLLSVATPAPGTGASASLTQFAYNSLGELTSITDPLGHQTTIAYFPTGLIQTIADAQNNVTAYAYDTRGNRTSVTDALSHETTFTYDSMSRLTVITYPDSTTTQFAYDYRGRRISVTDQNSKVTSYAYDQADRLLTVTDSANNVTTYGYDTESNLTSIEDANQNTTSFTYDAYGRVIQTNFPSTKVETYGYDNVGNLTGKTDRKNQLISYTYDQSNRLTQKAYPDTTTVNYTYDNDSRLTQVVDPTGTYGFTFDNMGRLTNATTSYSFLTGRNFTTAYSYDSASNRTGFTDPESGSTAYVYDTLNRLQTLTPPTAYGTGNFGFTYDAVSRRTALTRPNSVGTAYGYDTLNRLLNLTHAISGTTLDGTTYTLDSAGNRLTHEALPSDTTLTYTYDNIYELLTSKQGSTSEEGYTYDPVGNRLTDLGSTAWTYNTSNELNTRPTVSYTYDANGNTQTEVVSAGTTTFTWDFENRLTSVALPGTGGTVSFKYDPFGRRIYKSSSSATSVYAYDGDNLVEETGSTGTATARYAMGLNIDEPFAILQGTTTDYYQADGLGSITSLSNSSGADAETYTYDSFGNLTASTGSLTNRYRYTGREFDAETGLYYYRARYYDPSGGRFLSEDPVQFGGGINFYAYVANSPINFSDLSGLGPNGAQSQQIQNGLIQQIQNIFPGSSYNPNTNTLSIPQNPNAVSNTLKNQGYQQPGQWWNPFLYWDPIAHSGGDEYRTGIQTLSFHFRQPHPSRTNPCASPPSQTSLDQIHIDSSNPAVDPVGHILHDFLQIPRGLPLPPINYSPPYL